MAPRFRQIDRFLVLQRPVVGQLRTERWLRPLRIFDLVGLTVASSLRVGSAGMGLSQRLQVALMIWTQAVNWRTSSGRRAIGLPAGLT